MQKNQPSILGVQRAAQKNLLGWGGTPSPHPHVRARVKVVGKAFPLLGIDANNANFILQGC